jgi:hypothetical protein
MKICLVKTELYLTDGQTVAFRNFTNAPKKKDSMENERMLLQLLTSYKQGNLSQYSNYSIEWTENQVSNPGTG